MRLLRGPAVICAGCGEDMPYQPTQERTAVEAALTEVQSLIIDRRANLNATRDDREERRVRQGLRKAAEIVAAYRAALP